MNYKLVIEDLQNLQEPLVLHWAERGSLRQSWTGGDDKTQPIVGCEKSFTLENYGAIDGRYEEYFTTDEQRYRVTQSVEETGQIVYQGFFLPESYSEPYEAGVHYVSFSAVDGLGLLRGKQLEDDFYDKEHYVTDVIASILKLTGIPFDIYLAPAIKNHLKTKWHEIVIDGRKYNDPEKYPSAHDILEDLIFSMRCQLFQSEGRWYIEGINFRHLKTVKFDTYDIDGNFLGSFDVDKNIKRVHWSPTPTISMVPGLKESIVKHEAANLVISPEVFKETDITWVRATGVIGEFTSRHWDFTTFKPKNLAPEYYLHLPVGANPVHNPSSVIRLKDKLYVMAGYKVRVKLAFQLIPTPNGITTEEVQARRISGIWIDMIRYRLTLNDTQILSNNNTAPRDPERLVFDDNLKADVTLEFVAQQDGVLDLEIFEPNGTVAETLMQWVRVTDISIENIEQRKNFIYTEIINEDSSQVQEIDLPFSDDVSAESKCFYLEKLRTYPPHEHHMMWVPIKYGRTQNGKNYSIVSLEGAVAIEQFPDKLGYMNYSTKVLNPKVIYNLNGGEEMAIETTDLYTSGSFYVVMQAYEKPTIDRTEWLKWTDAVYNVEQKPYAQVVAEIEGKLFKDPHLMIEATVQNPIKFNDLIEFTFKDEKKYFVPSDVDWNPNENESRVTLIEGVYAGSSLGNIPPYVDAGPDIFIGPNDTTAQITDAVASDPDGVIQSLSWVRIAGTSPNISYSSPSVLNPLIGGITSDEETFQITATDNSGASATDTMRVLRVGNYVIEYELLDSAYGGSQGGDYIMEQYRLNIVPELPANVSLNLFFELIFMITLFKNNDYGEAFFSMTKNGNALFGSGFSANTEGLQTYNNVFQYNAGDEITIKFEARVTVQQSGSAQALIQLKFNDAVFVNGRGTVTNLPAEKSISADS